MTIEGDDPGFAQWLDQALQGITPPAAPSPLPAQATYHAAFLSGGTTMLPMTASLTAALTSKVAAGVAAGTLALGGAGAAAATASTGSANPGVWGKAVSTAVETCSDKTAAENQHGIGQCWSLVAKEHGQRMRTSPSLTRPLGPSHAPGVMPFDNAPGGMPSNTAPGQMPSNTAPGGMPPNTAPGGMPPKTAPGAPPSHTTPGGMPSNTVPGAMPSGGMH